jgi:hypothetical protein
VISSSSSVFSSPPGKHGNGPSSGYIGHASQQRVVRNRDEEIDGHISGFSVFFGPFHEKNQIILNEAARISRSSAPTRKPERLERRAFQNILSLCCNGSS